MLLDLAFISKNNKLITDQGLEKTQTPSSQEDIPHNTETTGSNTGQYQLFIT